MINSSFHIVILGTDLPALVFGALAAKKNYRVLVVGQRGHDNIYEIDALRFVSRPQLIYGLHSSTIISDCFGDLTLGPEIRNRPLPLDPIIQVVMPGVRLDLPVRSELFEQELKREFPALADNFVMLMDQVLQSTNKGIEEALAEFPVIPPRKFKDSFSHRGLATRLEEVVQPFVDVFEGLGRDPRAMAVVNAMGAGLALSPVQPGGVAHCRLLWHLRNGLVHIDWGLDEIRRIFLEKIRQNSGEVRLNETVASMSSNWKGAINTLTLERSGDTIGTALVALGMNPSEAMPLLPSGRKVKGFAEDLERYQPSHYVFTLNLGMDVDQVPEGMGHLVFNVLDPGKPLEGTNFLIVQTNPAMEPRSVQEGHDQAVISVTAFMPAAAFDGTIEGLMNFGAAVIHALQQDLLPFLRVDDVMQSIAAIRKRQADDEYFVDTRSLLPVYPQDPDKGLGLFTIPIQSAFKNVLNLGAEMTGGLGFEGVFYLAREALKITQGMVKGGVG